MNGKMKLLTVAVGGTYVALLAASAYAWRAIDRSLNDLKVDGDSDDDEPNESNGDDPNTRQLDPAVFRWVRQQDCGVVVDVVTGVVRREPQLPLGVVALDVAGLNASTDASSDAVVPSDVSMPEAVERLLGEFFASVTGDATADLVRSQSDESDESDKSNSSNDEEPNDDDDDDGDDGDESNDAPQSDVIDDVIGDTELSDVKRD